MICSHCHKPMSPQDAATYGGRCEVCWATGQHDTRHPHQRPIHADVLPEPPRGKPAEPQYRPRKEHYER